MKLLLTSVFGPFAVDDEYGEKENKMELFHNQVTREQGIFSYRFNHPSHGLYFMAENVDIPTTVLDFPTLRRFKREIRKGYDYIGISFITPNFKKAKKMAEIIRKLSPRSKIILGGHGANIPNIENLIEHDHICRGEGVFYLRKLFKENVNRPIKHSLTYSSYNRTVMGVPWPADAGILITGVGCPNKCRFCATSHFFNDYIPYLKTGQEIYNVCVEYEDKLGITDFGILDENFLKSKTRAIELLNVMEKNNRFFTFAIFSSAETLTGLDDLDFLVKLGVDFIWIGIESKKEIYEKNKGVDFHLLIKELQKRGISVMASMILFLEDHNHETIWEDIDFGTSLNPEYLQFMQLGPIPGTALYKNYEQENKLLKDIPYEAQHGQKRIWFKHEHFTLDESEQFLKDAFRADYKRNGASIIRAIQTRLKGYDYVINHDDPLIRTKASSYKKMLELMRYFLLSARFFSENKATTDKLKDIRSEYKRLLGQPGIIHFCASIIVLFITIITTLKIKLFSDVRHPGTICKKFNFKAKEDSVESPSEIPEQVPASF